jgi:hypothetical protein
MNKILLFLSLSFLLLNASFAQDTEEEKEDTIFQNLPVVTLEQLSESDEDDGNTYSLLNASGDAFESAIGYNLGRYRFQFRGYESKYNAFQINNVPVNDLNLGWFSYGLLGGLNNVLYGRNNSLGLESNNLGLGGVGGLSTLDLRAGNQRKTFRPTYSFSNGAYKHRIMLTYNTGVTEKKWAVSMSVNKRWAQEGYIEGTFYDTYGYFLGVEKFFKEKHRVALSVIGNAGRRGRPSSAIQEVYDLAGSNFYNSNWGYQDGEKRNASVARQNQPLIFLNYEWKDTEKLILRSGTFAQVGMNGSSALNWFDGKDPRPDYYRNLPSYQTNPVLIEAVTNAIEADPNLLQLDWDYMYEANRNNDKIVENVDGIQGNTLTGNAAVYLVEERRFDNLRFGHHTSFEWNAAENVTLHGGVSWQRQKTHYFKVVQDLLDADFHMDFNQFAERDFPDDQDAAQNNLLTPNRVVYEGDKFGYDYDAVTCETGLWTQALITFDNVDVSLGAGLSNNHFFREGRYQNGIFPDNSLGKSEKFNFIQYQFKGNVTYKISGKHYLYASGGYETKAPTFMDAFISPRTRNDVIPGLTSEKIASTEAGYLMKSADYQARAVFYYTSFRDQVQNISFYNDAEQNFVNYSLRNINTQHLGVELMVEAKILPSLYANAVAVLGRNIHTSRPLATITQDNTAEVLVVDEVVYADNYYLGGHQQNVFTLGLDYRSPKFWRVGIDMNYLNGMWIPINPARRTEQAVSLVEADSEQWHNILDQEKTDPAVTLDLNGGYSWKMDKTIKGMKKSWYMYLNVGLTNVLNKKDIVTGGFEQFRYDFENRDPETFPNRYFYAYGFSAYVNLSFRL